MAQIIIASSNKYNRTIHRLSPSFRPLPLLPRTQVTLEEAIGTDLLLDLQVGGAGLPPDREVGVVVMLDNVEDVAEVLWVQGGVE